MSVSADLTMEQPQGHACTACQTVFEDPEKQRKHYKTDWHRFVLWGFNENFNERVTFSNFPFQVQSKAKGGRDASSSAGSLSRQDVHPRGANEGMWVGGVHSI